MSTVAAVDVGGSFVKLALVDARGTIHARAQLAFPAHAAFAGIAAAIATETAALIQAAPSRHAPELLGLSMPGYLHPRSGRLLAGGDNVPTLRGHNLAAALGRALALPVAAANDGTCALHGELAFGIGRRVRDFAMFTLGTGVGGGIVIGGAPLGGHAALPAEIGHLCLDARGRRCPCGNRGCLERYVGGPALLRTYAALGRTHATHGAPPTGAEDVFRRARRGESRSRRAVALLAERLAQGLGLIANLMHMDAFVLGGGLAGAGPALLRPVREALPRYVYAGRAAGLRVHLSALGNDAGLLGAAALALRRYR